MGVKPLFLATLSFLAAELYQWDLFYCSVHFLSSSRSETSSFFLFFFYCYLAENLPSSHASFSIRSLPPYIPSSFSSSSPLSGPSSSLLFLLSSFQIPFFFHSTFLSYSPLLLILHQCLPLSPPASQPAASPRLLFIHHDRRQRERDA